ncbi:hypothetical protein J2I47_22975 [Fibrella sp. HMF5335]|uniref:Uncharacterized protein n=1 Tax=Fibrella rubiginis TaxID=2817060 RepID=A0A939K7H5_9BACT|nr:hypothetical protein [Fibrella rubiginis]MBO0939431.1 hypothetical protein [Fibrella rubiginis]
MKATVEELTLLRQLAAEQTDPTTSAILFEKYYPVTVDKLRKKYRDVDEDVVRDVVFEVLTGLIENPSKYDPERATLAAYLAMDAQGDLLNKLKKGDQEKKSVKFVEDWELYGNIIEEVATNSDEKQVLSLIQEKLQEIFWEPRDADLAKMIIRGDRNTADYVGLLGLSERPFDEQQALVKQHKDRIKRVLERKGWYTFEEKLKQRFL